MFNDLEPKLLWTHFAHICQIPHCSGREAVLRDSLLGLARQRGWTGEVDDVGNLVIYVPAKPGHESAQTVVLQGHMDMVCEKNNDTDHDFQTQGIDAYSDGEMVRARGTTLGADNGIAIAAALALADDPAAKHGPLEILCTVEEETGLTGAADVQADMIHGRVLINIDSEEEGAVYVGCAGGGDQDGIFTPPRGDAPEGTVAMKINVAGLLGGHSGLDIHLGRGNAVVLLTRLIHQGLTGGLITAVDTFGGGNLHNAIPREASGVVRVPQDKLNYFEQMVQARLATEKETLGDVDPGLTMTAEAVEAAGTTIAAADIGPFISMLLELPPGVVAMSEEIEGLVETSNNLAVVKDNGGALTVKTSSRSSVADELTKLRAFICRTMEKVGCEIHSDEGYPGWEPDMDSKLLARAKRVYQEQFDKEVEVKAIHAGLECGIIGEPIPGMDTISIGPTIFSPHSPDERIEIATVGKFWTFFAALMADLAEG